MVKRFLVVVLAVMLVPALFLPAALAPTTPEQKAEVDSLL